MTIYITPLHVNRFAVIYNDAFSSHTTYKAAQANAHAIAHTEQEDIADLVTPIGAEALQKELQRTKDELAHIIGHNRRSRMQEQIKLLQERIEAMRP